MFGSARARARTFSGVGQVYSQSRIPSFPFPLSRVSPARSPLRPDAAGQDASLELAVVQARAQDLLVELADARLRDLGDERELVRQPPFRDARAQVLDQRVDVGLRTVAQHHAAQRSLRPALVG